MRPLALAAALLLTACAVADDPAPPSPAPTPPPAPPPEATTPAATAPAISPQLDAWLDKIEQRAATLRTYRVDKLVFKTVTLAGDEQRRLGTLAYDAGPPARFHVHFTKLITDGGRADPMDSRYVFDGRWLLERNGLDKLAIRRQVVPPDADPAAVDPLAAGRGPFVLPLRPRKDDLLRRFSIELIPPNELDPGDSVHLRLTPRHDTEGSFRSLDLWYGYKSLLPLRAHLVSDDETTIDLKDARPDADLKDNPFDTTLPNDPSWRTEQRAYEEQ